MSNIHFVVEEAPEGGFIAKAINEDIITEADDMTGLRQNVRDAVHCHFDDNAAPKVIHLHFTREEVLAA